MNLCFIFAVLLGVCPGSHAHEAPAAQSHLATNQVEVSYLEADEHSRRQRPVDSVEVEDERPEDDSSGHANQGLLLASLWPAPRPTGHRCQATESAVLVEAHGWDHAARGPPTRG